MNHKMLLLLLLPCLLPAQYWGEKPTEKSFEKSELYFTSHYLNTFGMHRFKNVAPNLIEDPFLDLHTNPAQLPDLNKNNLFYLDFRGDRSEAPVVQGYPVMPLYYDRLYYPGPYIDPRWVNNTRKEPEPVFSAGFLTYLKGGRHPNFFLGGTYQLIHKQENFYSVPDWIYSSRYGYDSFGIKNAETDNVPIEDRYSGTDEMLNSGHLFSGFLGYGISRKLNIGISLNGVIHSRNGEFRESHRDEYGNIDNREWESLRERKRDQEYDHLDAAAGLQIRVSKRTTVGVKVGKLTGTATQQFLSTDSSLYSYNEREVSPEWYYSKSRSLSDQDWKNEGDNIYAGFNINHKLNRKQLLRFYYRFSNSEINLSNSSFINDTSYYAGRWIYQDTSEYYYRNTSSLSDVRSGTGSRQIQQHEAMINMKWELTRISSLFAGFYFAHNDAEISSSEPVTAFRKSHYLNTGYYEQDYLRILNEDKNLHWNYRNTNWTIQIPLFLNFRIHKTWGILLGVNKSLNSWDIREQTLATFSERENNENGVLKTETDFGERYTEPRQRISEEFTDTIARLNINISPNFQVNLLVNPKFDKNIRIAQWWLGFRSNF